MTPCKKCGHLLGEGATLCSECWAPQETDVYRKRLQYTLGGTANKRPGGALADGLPRYEARPVGLPLPSPAHRLPSAAEQGVQALPTQDGRLPSFSTNDVPPPEWPQPSEAHPPSFRWFFERIPGLVLMAFILVFALFVGGRSETYFSSANLRNLLQSFCVLAPFAAGIAVTARANGPDLSLGSIALYGGMLMAAGAPFPAALIAGMIAGFINGVLVWLFRLPALIVTLVTGQILLGAVYVSSRMDSVSLEGGHLISPATFFAVGLFTLAAAFLYVLLTPAGTPFAQRGKDARSRTFLFAYPLAGILAAFGGVLSIMRMGGFAPAGDLYYGGGSLIDLLFIWAATASSRLLDNRVAPVLYAALAAFVLALLNNAMAFSGFDPLIQGYGKAVLCLLMLFCVGLARWPFAKTAPIHYPGDT